MSTFENDLRLEEIGTGERAGTWGTATNTNLELIANALSYSSTGEAIANASTHTITMADGAEDEFRSFYLKCTGGGQACTVTLAPNTLSKVWMIENTTSATLTFSQGSGANVAVLAGQVKIIGTNGVGNAGAVFDLMQDLAVPDLFVDDDLTLQSDAAVLGFGADKDVTLTHVHDAGLLLNAAMKIQFRDAALSIGSSADGQLDIIADTEIQIAATTIDINGAINASGEISAVSLDISGDVDVDGTLETDALSLNGTAVTSTAAELNILDGVTSTTAELNILDGVTSTAAELNILDGATVVVAEINALDVGSTAFGTAVASKAVILDSNKDSTGIRNLTLTGNLTIPNDGLFAATNTAGNILVADGTNFNSTAVSSLSEISTAANDDVFLAIDTSGGGLKKITRSTVLAGTGSSTDIANVVEDTSPQLGGNLDMNGQDIVTVSNATIDLAPNGTGTVVVRGNTNSGAIVFNCESNSHGQKVFGQPHSASVTNTLMLPAGADSTLLSRVSVDTLTNKTLTSPKINEDVAVTSTATELNILDGVTSTTAELNILDGVTSTTAELNILDGVTSTAAELNILDGVTSTAAELNILDGVTSTAAELNILDGVTSTAAELNLVDGLVGIVAKTSATGSALLPTGNTAQRDGSPTTGAFRFNSTLTAFEGYNGSAWGSVGGGASGGGSNEMFYENDQVASSSYTIPANRNALTTGPITIADGVTITVSDGSRLVVI